MLAHDSQGNLVNVGSGLTVLGLEFDIMIYREAQDVLTYDRDFTVYSPRIELDANGNVGVVFGEPITIPVDLFDSGIDQYLPEIPPQYMPYDLSDAFLPQQSVIGAFGSGFKTGAKANVNGLSSAVVSTVTIGIVEKVEPWAVTDLDRAYGYDAAFAIANASGNILVTAGTCGAGMWAQGAGRTGQVVNYGIRGMDFGSNVVGGGKNIYDIAENGPNFANVTGVITNGVCAGIHVKTFASDMKVKYNSPKPTNRFDLHADLRSKGFEYKSTSQGGNVTYKHPDGRIVTIKPTGEVIPTSPTVSSIGKKYNERTDYDFIRLPDQSHSTGHFVEPIRINPDLRN